MISLSHKTLDHKIYLILHRFAEALQLEFDFVHATEKGKWDEAYSVFLSVQEKQRALEADQDIVRCLSLIPYSTYLLDFLGKWIRFI